ncbi:MAG TPA: glycosyltransferase family 9 protein [Acetobacteraceae bacterium]
MTTAVVQPLPGIGDMVWHLPHIRAIAEHLREKVTLVAKPRSLADQLFGRDDVVGDIVWVDQNPSGRRGLHDGIGGFTRLVGMLRASQFDSVVILHHSHRIAAAAMLAGIRRRQGYGLGSQRLFLNEGPYLTAADARLHQFRRASRFLEAASIPMAEQEPRLRIGADAHAAIRTRTAALPRPFVAIGIGSSEPSRQWGAARQTALARLLLEAGWPALALVGGPADGALADQITRGLGAAAEQVVPILGWHLMETAALLSEAAFYVGNNTGIMNMAAAAGIRAYALFGTTPVFDHSRDIVPIASPAGGPDDGMARMDVDAALEAVRLDRGRTGP